MEPQFISFPAYTTTEIAEIIQSRLLDTPELFQPAAIELCARKVSAFGDFRKALSICHHALELLEQELKKRPEAAFKVTVKHVIRAIDAGLGVASLQKLKALTLHQQSVMVILVLIERANKSESNIELSILRVFEVYLCVCRYTHWITEVSRSEFMDIISAIESAGLLQLVGAKNKTPSKPGSAKRINTPGSGNSTPKRKFGTPVNRKSGGFSTPKGNDLMNRIMMLCSHDEVEQGVNGDLQSLLRDGLPASVLQLYHERPMID